MKGDNATYFGVEYMPKETKKLIGNKNIYRIQAIAAIMCGYFRIGFINVILKRKSLLDYTNLFSPSKYENKNKIILKYFQ